MKKTAIPAAIAASLLLTLALAAPHALAQQQRAAIHFADIGNIHNWQAEGMDAILIQNDHKEWYRATFWSPCVNLPFATGVAFVTEFNGDLDSFSSILVEGERCWFRSFDSVTAPENDDGRIAIVTPRSGTSPTE